MIGHLFVLGITHVTTAQFGRLGCEINVQEDFPDYNPPVVLAWEKANKSYRSSQYRLAEPSSRDSRYSYIGIKNQTILLACPGHKNVLNSANRLSADASCNYVEGRTYFEIQNRAYQTDQVQCAKRVTPTELITCDCNSDGVLVQLGYLINSKHYKVIQTCHRLHDGMTYYSQHQLSGSHFSLSGKSSKFKRPRFSFHNKALYNKFPPYEYYKAEEQRKLIANITGDPTLFNHKKGKFFSKGHLTPNADFVLSTWRDVTFLFVNTAPQWQDINGNNWERIERAVRNHVIKTGQTYEVVTGTHGVLTVNGQQVYLDSAGRRLPVPEHFIKLVREIQTNKCIAFIANNFPLEKPPEVLCQDKCQLSGWPNLKAYKDKGYVHCCLYEGLGTTFAKTLPAMNCTGGVLESQGSRITT